MTIDVSTTERGLLALGEILDLLDHRQVADVDAVVGADRHDRSLARPRRPIDSVTTCTGCDANPLPSRSCIWIVAPVSGSGLWALTAHNAGRTVACREW